MLSINFNLLSVLLHYAYHQISDFEIYTAITTNMVVKHIVLFNITSVASDNILRICIQEPLLISKKFIVLFILYEHITAYSSAIKFSRLIPGNVSKQAEGMVKPMKTLALIQHHIKRIL